MTSLDVDAIAALVRDRDAWQRLALQALGVLQSRTASVSEPWPGQHEAQVEAFKKMLIEHTLGECEWNVRLTANRLGLNRTTLINQMERLGLVRASALMPREVAGV